MLGHLGSQQEQAVEESLLALSPELPALARLLAVAVAIALGSGAFGQVRSATLIEEPAECRAVKVLEKDGARAEWCEDRVESLASFHESRF